MATATIAVPAEVELPVRISVGEHTAEAGTITLDRGQPVGEQIAEFLRAVADEMETADDGNEDGED
ncbi:hypothetical protein [Streptomonospora wellingtoniae]|uniref:Uncharacterized protein n=1 Tax=Streptomonospora wellingtoniae TaxID=3075544 RepID=A0ABU2L0X8_9ACTN|nr:hypothetical protein [Streptomonospora sp. DSM 45055]MDT0305066.1 hypothetical protein [Streptomonospora sp. DSM 45055]